jgi:hypothetical protein
MYVVWCWGLVLGSDDHRSYQSRRLLPDVRAEPLQDALGMKPASDRGCFESVCISEMSSLHMKLNMFVVSEFVASLLQFMSQCVHRIIDSSATLSLLCVSVSVGGLD